MRLAFGDIQQILKCLWHSIPTMGLGCCFVLTLSCESNAPPVIPSTTPAAACVCEAGTPKIGAWSQCKLSYHINGNVTVAQKLEIIGAFKLWEQHTGLTFNETESALLANIVIVYRNYSDSEKQSRLDSIIKYCPSKVNEPPLASTCYVGNTSACLPKGTVIFNTRASITISNEIPWGLTYSQTSTVYNLYPTVVHEIGHAMGLPHSTNPQALMYCYFTGENITFHQDDIDAIEKLSLPDCSIPTGVGVSFSGVVTSVELIGDYPVSYLLAEYEFVPGDTFVGLYMFDPNTPESGLGDYRDYVNAITWGSITFSNGWEGNGSEPKPHPFGTDRIQVVNDQAFIDNGSSFLDSYYANTRVVDGPNILSSDLHFSSWHSNGRARFMQLYMVDSTAQAFGSTDLPTDIPPVTAFDAVSFIMGFGPETEPNLWVHGRVENLENVELDQ